MLPLPEHDRDARRRATRSRRFLVACGRRRASTSSSSTGRHGRRHRRTSRRPDFWINGGYFVFRREIFDYIRARRGAGRGAVPAADRRGRAARVPVRRLLGADGHVEGQADARRRSRDGRAPWPMGRRRATAGKPRSMPSVMLRCRCSAPGRIAAVLALGRPRGRHRDRLRRNAARARGGQSGVDVTGSCSAQTGARADEARASAAAFLGRSPRRQVVVDGFRDGFFPYGGGGGQGAVRGS